MKKQKKQFIYAVCEVTPSPIGDTIRILVFREAKEDAERILKVLNETDYDFSLYKIIDYPMQQRLMEI